jgi:iron complex transport system substrate-binding protein
MRIVSLLPSATDIVVALGAQQELVGVSHSCGSQWSNLPRLTSTRINVAAGSGAIDTQVKTSNEPLYDLDLKTLERLSPDVVVSQSLCDVCAVPSGDVEKAVTQLSSQPILVNLSPFRLADIPKGIEDVGDAIHRRTEAALVVDDWDKTLAGLRRDTGHRRRVAFLDWLEPPFAAGHWIPDMIQLLGGESVLAKPGEPSHEISWEGVRAAEPDIVIAACCGHTAERASKDHVPNDLNLHLLDGYEHFSRPGPGLLRSARMLSQLLDEQLSGG